MASNKLEITKDKVLRASKKCPQAKEVLKELFSEAFEDEWKDITGMVEPEIIYAAGNKPYLRFIEPRCESTGSGFANSAATNYTPSISIPLFIYHPEKYKIEKDGEDSFRIFKRN